MKILGLLVGAFLLWNVRSEEIFTRTYRWTNFDDFLASNWTQGDMVADQWNNPVDLDQKLVNLSSNFTDKVWGWKATKNGSKYFHLAWEALPEYCGTINATLEVKLYFSHNYTENFMGPAVGPDPYLRFKPMPRVEWQTVSGDLNISYHGNPTFVIHHYTPIGEIFLIDEVSLTYSARQNDENCPYSCNHDCEYRAIDCHRYYTCVERKYKKIHSCSKDDGLAFNPMTKTCDLLEKVEGCNSPPEICICAYKPHETNYSSYYFCNNTCLPKECEERHCPSGLVWSTDALGDGSGLQQCVLSGNTTCQGETKAETTRAHHFAPPLGDFTDERKAKNVAIA